MKKTAKNPLLSLWFGPYYVIVFLRFFLPILIWRNPFWISFFCFILDWFDNEFFRLGARGKVSPNIYQVFDKTLDYYWYFFVFLYSFRLSIFNLLLCLFAFRTFGTLFYFFTMNRKYFLYFPNFFENVFLFYVTASFFPSLNFLLQGRAFYIMILVVSLAKLIQEYLVHQAVFSFHEWITGNDWFKKTSSD